MPTRLSRLRELRHHMSWISRWGGVLAAIVLISSLGAGPAFAFGPEGEWVVTGPPALPDPDIASSFGTLVTLPDGRVFQIGPQVRQYDPSTGAWAAAGSLLGGGGVATILSNGKILVTGLSPAEVYDPATQTSTLTGAMVTPRFGHQATLLASGDVLVSGGMDRNNALVGAAEIYHAGAFTGTGAMKNPRVSHTAILLQTGKVLAAGGSAVVTALTSAELYDPTSGTWTLTNSNTVGGGVSGLLGNGQVLVVGIATVNLNFTTASQVFDPATSTWGPVVAVTGLGPFQPGALTRLLDGRFLLIGSALAGGCFVLDAGVYDQAAGTWIRGAVPRPSGGNLPSLALLSDGRALLGFVQGCASNFKAIAQLFRPDNTTARPALTPSLFLEFGQVPAGATAQLPVTVQNTGQAQLVGSAVLTNAPGFSLVSGANYTLDSGTSSQTVIGFSSATAGTFVGTATFMSNGGWVTVALIATVVNRASVARDFDGDGSADILWRHSSGFVFTWLLNGTSARGVGSPGTVATDWSIVGIGDFNGDGKADILWRHTSGALYIWLMNGVNVIGTGSPGSVPTDWTVAGVGDFNGDGKADILWRHSSGVVFIWLLNGVNVIGIASPGTVATDWAIAGVGDFNGDGKADILWRHSSGVVFIWLLNGTSVIGTGSPGSVPNDWSIQGVGDFNGDGKSDILWRHTSGAVFIWLLNSTSVSGSGSPGTAGADWFIRGVADVNGDGKADILWQHVSGTVFVWLINGTQVIGTGSPGAVDPSWTIQ